MIEVLRSAFERHLDGLRRIEHNQEKTVIDWQIRADVDELEYSNQLGRAELVKEFLRDSRCQSANDLYRAACILYSTFRMEELALSHMCLLRVAQIHKANPNSLEESYRENWRSLAIDSWNAFMGQIDPPPPAD